MRTSLTREQIIEQLRIWNTERLDPDSDPRIIKHYSKMLKEVQSVLNNLLQI